MTKGLDDTTLMKMNQAYAEHLRKMADLIEANEYYTVDFSVVRNYSGVFSYEPIRTTFSFSVTIDDVPHASKAVIVPAKEVENG